MDLAKLNKLTRDLPTKKWSELKKEGNSFTIIALKNVSTRFGERVVIVLDENFQVYLPTRVSVALENNPEFCNDLADRANKLALLLSLKKDNFEFEYV